MALATFHSGEPIMVPHVPGSAVAEGSVVVVGDLTLISHTDIAASDLGSLASGGGLYTVPKASSGAIAAGVRLYWDAGNSRVTTTKSTHKVFGWSPQGAADGATSIVAFHAPEFDDIGAS